MTLNTHRREHANGKLFILLSITSDWTELEGLGSRMSFWCCTLRFSISPIDNWLHTMRKNSVDRLHFVIAMVWDGIFCTVWAENLCQHYRLSYLIYKSSVPTSEKTRPITITKICWLVTFRDLTALYSEYEIKLINTLCWCNGGLLNIDVGGYK